MLRQRKVIFGLVIALALGVTVMGFLVPPGFAQNRAPVVRKVIVPEADRFTKFAITIHRGDSVKWINRDTDDHVVVSDDFFNTAGNDGTDHVVPGTVSHGGTPGKFKLTFTKAGTFIYYCRFHAQLDAEHQPIAPGPGGGIPGTPMMGVITVLP